MVSVVIKSKPDIMEINRFAEIDEKFILAERWLHHHWPAEESGAYVEVHPGACAGAVVFFYRHRHLYGRAVGHLHQDIVLPCFPHRMAAAYTAVLRVFAGIFLNYGAGFVVLGGAGSKTVQCHDTTECHRTNNGGMEAHFP